MLDQKGKLSLSAILLKHISYNAIRQTWMDAVMFDNDASACYDRIIPSMSVQNG